MFLQEGHVDRLVSKPLDYTVPDSLSAFLYTREVESLPGQTCTIARTKLISIEIGRLRVQTVGAVGHIYGATRH